MLTPRTSRILILTALAVVLAAMPAGWQLNWTKRTPSTSPSARAEPAMANDLVRQRMILFGGIVAGRALNDTLGTSGDTAAIQAAWNAGVFDMAASTYLVDGLDLPSNADLSGLRGVTFKRKNSATNSYVIRAINKDNLNLTGEFTVDGNTDNQSVPADNLYFSGCGNVQIGRNVLSKGAFSDTSNYGRGVYFVDGTDQSDETRSVISVRVIDCYNTGILIDKSQGVLIDGAFVKGSRFSQIAVVDFTLPVPSNPVNARIAIIGCQIDGSASSAGNGITFNGSRSGTGTGGQDIISVFNPVHAQYVIANNLVSHCATYGISAQGIGVAVTGNAIFSCGVFANSTGLSTPAGGVLFTCNSSILSNNSIVGCSPFGVDLGAAYGSTVEGNVISVRVPNNGTVAGINAGACRHTTVRGNKIVICGPETGTGCCIRASALDGSGVTNYAPWVGFGLEISENTCRLNNKNEKTSGIVVFGGWKGLVIEGNDVYDMIGTRRANAFDLRIVADRMKNVDNIAWDWDGSRTLTVASAATINVTDWAEEVRITGTAMISRIETAAMVTIGDGVSQVDMTNNGSDYTSVPTVVFSGGGGSGAAGTAAISADRKIYGVVMTKNGSGYLPAPTVSFTGGGGRGAAGTAVVGIANQNGRRLVLHFAAGATLKHSTSDAENIYL